MSSYDGSRSARQSKRYSMSALYMSMSANEGEMQIEDDLAKGGFSFVLNIGADAVADGHCSSENTAGSKD